MEVLCSLDCDNFNVENHNVSPALVEGYFLEGNVHKFSSYQCLH